MLKAVAIAEKKNDSNGILKATDAFMDLLQMKQGKRIITDTMQIDMTSQIADQIETEEKKLTISRKTEAEDDKL
jgi:ABC-type sulfate transport system substrate-binding protein